jgi:hypothetical protein
MEPEVRETVDYIAIRRLQDAYADVVTRRAWDELGDLFRPDAEVSVDVRVGEPRVMVGPDGIGTFIDRAIARFERFQFVVLGTVVDLAGADADRATARLYMCELRQSVDDGHESVAYGVYHDDYVRHEGRWWFARRRYHSLARTAPDLAVFPFPDVTPGSA